MSTYWDREDFPTEADLKAENVFCCYCGTPMAEVLHPAPGFDRKTGRQHAFGSLHWECPKRGIGLAVMSGEWFNTHDENPHDSFLLADEAGRRIVPAKVSA
jgi:hypothetical protein